MSPTGAKTPLTAQGQGDGRYGGGRVRQDGKGLYVTTDAGAEFQRLAYMDLATKKTDVPDAGHADMDGFDLSDDGRTIAYVTNEKGVSVAAAPRHGDAARAAAGRSSRSA